MTLSNTRIEDAIKRGSLIVTPTPTRKRLGVTSVDVRLGDKIYVVNDPSKKLFFDARTQSIQAFWEQIGHEVDLRLKQVQPFADADGKFRRRTGYWLAPGEVCLAFTHEHFQLPTTGVQVLQGKIWNRSRTARAFVRTHIDAPEIKPGTNNQITLEIKNDGPFYVRLSYLDEIAQVGFEEVKGVVRATKSTFHGQKKPSGI
jgi:deoxycytidine triphosphate deaminase